MCIYKDERLVYKRVTLEYKLKCSGMIYKGGSNKRQLVCQTWQSEGKVLKNKLILNTSVHQALESFCKWCEKKTNITIHCFLGSEPFS